MTQEMPVRFDMNGLRREHRELYRVLRKFGFHRNDANLVVFGAVIGSDGGWPELAMRMLGVKVTFTTDPANESSPRPSETRPEET